MDSLSDRFMTVEKNLRVIRANIEKAAQRARKRPEDILLLAATKTVDAEVVNHAIKLGVRCVGENRVQELLLKYDALHKEGVESHFIGHLQTNKVADIVDKVSMIQSVDRLRLAEEIDRQAAKRGKVMNILVEVNIGEEASKSGVRVQDTEALIRDITRFPHLKVRGLMTIPPFCDNLEETRQYFSIIRKLFIDITGKKIDNVTMDFLSMGMSDDYEEAIASGANIVRIGSALFGSRKMQHKG